MFCGLVFIATIDPITPCATMTAAWGAGSGRAFLAWQDFHNWTPTFYTRGSLTRLGLLQSEFKLKEQAGAHARKIRQIEICGCGADFAAGNLRFEGGAHQHFGGDLPIKRWAKINGIAGEGIERQSLIMLQIPEIGSDDDFGDDLIGQRRRHTPGQFLLPGPEIGARRFRLLEKIGAEEQTILDQLDIGFKPGFETIIYDFGPACLVAAMKFRLD